MDQSQKVKIFGRGRSFLRCRIPETPLARIRSCLHVHGRLLKQPPRKSSDSLPHILLYTLVECWCNVCDITTEVRAEFISCKTLQRWCIAWIYLTNSECAEPDGLYAIAPVAVEQQ